MSVRTIYYYLKPFIPRFLQLFLRRKIILHKRDQYSDVWPIDHKSGNPPKHWLGWPDRKKFAFILTHDVDTFKGHENCQSLIELEKSLGFRSSFNFVPKRYNVSQALLSYIKVNGSEVGVHGLYHDGKLYSSRKAFQERAEHINQYIKNWEALGFRSPSMHHNLGWIHELDIVYDASTFDTDPFEPQSDGVGTIFPFWVQSDVAQKGYIELPYTLPQDFTLFILLQEKDIDIWKRKLDWIAEHGGMALLNCHPDYMNFDGKNMKTEEYPVRYYLELLEYVDRRYKDQYWHVLPKEMAQFWIKTMVKSFQVL